MIKNIKAVWIVMIFPKIGAEIGGVIYEVAFSQESANEKKEFYENDSKVFISGPYRLDESVVEGER